MEDIYHKYSLSRNRGQTVLSPYSKCLNIFRRLCYTISTTVSKPNSRVINSCFPLISDVEYKKNHTAAQLDGF